MQFTTAAEADSRGHSVQFKVLAAGNDPDFRTIADFRKIHLEALQGLIAQVLELALEPGSVQLGRVSLDGTKIKANASRHKAMSYGRAQEKQRQLRQEVKELLAQATAADEEEDRRHGNRRGGELPEELRRREARLAKIGQAKPAEKDQYSFTDPESRIMKTGDGFDRLATIAFHAASFLRANLVERLVHIGDDVEAVEDKIVPKRRLTIGNLGFQAGYVGQRSGFGPNNWSGRSQPNSNRQAETWGAPAAVYAGPLPQEPRGWIACCETQ